MLSVGDDNSLDLFPLFQDHPTYPAASGVILRTGPRRRRSLGQPSEERCWARCRRRK